MTFGDLKTQKLRNSTVHNLRSSKVKDAEEKQNNKQSKEQSEFKKLKNNRISKVPKFKNQKNRDSENISSKPTLVLCMWEGIYIRILNFKTFRLFEILKF